jgi:hypothetical protein
MGFFGKPTNSGVVYSADELKIFAATYEISKTVILFGIAGVLVIGSWAWGTVAPPPDHAGFFACVGVDLLVAGAAAAVGALFGFVFGIPRSLEPASRAAVAAVTAGKPDDSAASRAAMGVNTNLERISDWLTTLLIGATLVQIKEIAGWVSGLGKNLLVTGPAANDAIVPIIVIYFFALSFLGVYLITRLYLTSALGLLGLSAAPTRSQTGTAATDAAAARKTAPDISVLKRQLIAALASGKSGDLADAISAYDKWVFAGDEGNDAELNANVVRILAKQMKASGTTDRAADLKAALAKAAADPATKAQLKTAANSKQLTTGNDPLDAEIAAALS